MDISKYSNAYPNTDSTPQALHIIYSRNWDDFRPHSLISFILCSHNNWPNPCSVKNTQHIWPITNEVMFYQCQGTYAII